MMGYYYFSPGQPMAIQANPPYPPQLQGQQYYQPNMPSPNNGVPMKDLPPKGQPVQYPSSGASQSNGEDGGARLDINTILKEVKVGLSGEQNSW